MIIYCSYVKCDVKYIESNNSQNIIATKCIKKEVILSFHPVKVEEILYLFAGLN